MKSRQTKRSLPSYEERQRVCGNKVSYPTLAQAMAYIRDANSRLPLSHYRCPICKGYHVTSSPD